jgi:site-specific DNA-cytosine methylase
MTYVDNPFKSPNVISFCPGILGIERGLKRAGVDPRVVAYVEIDAYIIANLVAGMESGMVDPAPIWTDAKTFDALPFRGKIHGIIGGYPCPGESTAGLREGHLYKGFLWPAIRKAVDAARPLWCFFENVDDHLTGTYPIVLRSLQNMGYRVEAGIFSAEEVGAPHERKRLYILAVADSYCYGYGTGASGTFEKGSQTKTKEQREEWKDKVRQWMRDVVGNGGKVLGSDQWPARPGEQQFEWEEPRTIKPGLGVTIRRYNFRKDLLRALGNSVVEQTAELAFKTLINKHL